MKNSMIEEIVYVGSNMRPKYDGTTSSIDVKYLKPENNYILRCENKISEWFKKIPPLPGDNINL